VRAAALLSAAAVFGLVLAGCGDSSQKAVTSVVTVTAPAPATATAPAPATSAGGEATPDVVARVLPSVVNVRTAGFDGSKSEASGVVIDRHGIILTNNHVVEGARTLTVSFNDGRHTKPVRGVVVGTAAERDLAIIRVPLDDLAPLPLGRSSKLRLGDGVLAIGFPLDLGGGPTVTQGIVSGLDRTVHAEGGPDLEGLLQTDAAINPGNSGGALVDSSGKLVGINTVAAKGAENVGFAISIDEARPVIDEIRSKPADKRAWIGVTFASIDSESAAVQIGLAPDTRGAAVTALFAGSPGAKAGLREGDVVVAINGRPVRSAGAFAQALSALDPGATVALDVVDQSGPRRVTLTVGKRPATLPGG
jgi:S1-C subfamily serine protease